MTYKEIRKNKEVLAYLKKGNDNLGVLGFTDHSEAHTTLVAERGAKILAVLGYSEHEQELARSWGLGRGPLRGAEGQERGSSHRREDS